MSGIPSGDTAPQIETDPTTPVGMVRLLITDTTAPALFTDEQLERFLTAHANSIKRAAATALDIMSVSELWISRKFSTQDLSVDGTAVAKGLQDLADRLRAQAKAEEDAATAAEYAIDTVALWRFPEPQRWLDAPL